jgi:glucokinase
MSRTVLAGDLGGTHLRAALVDEAGGVSARLDVATPGAASPGEIREVLAGLLSRAAAQATTPPEGGCIALPGLVDADAGKVIFAPNVAGFRNLALAEPLSERLGIPIWLENDASAAALGEHRYGAGRGTRHLLHASLGTGIGGGIVIDGRLYRGARGLAGEIGHVVLDPSGPRCPCGSRGCLEAMVSGAAFSVRAKRLIESGKSPALRDLVGARPPTAADLHAAARAGDAASEAEIRHGGHLLGLALGGYANILNPEAITLSGGLLQMGEMLLGPVKEAMYSIAYGPASGTLLRLTTLGEDAGLLGAAAVAFERSTARPV